MMSTEQIANHIEKAFAGVTLGDGIGLYEANGIDDRKSYEELAMLRAQDEKHDWRNVRASDLKKCWCSYPFLDERGLRFYLPAMMLGELRGETMAISVQERLLFHSDAGRYALLSAAQRDAVRVFLVWALSTRQERYKPEEKAGRHFWGIE